MGYAEENALRVRRGVVLRVFDVAVSLSEGLCAIPVDME